MDYSFWALFIMTAVMLAITPGPDMVYLVTRSMSAGKKAGFATVLGLGTGALIHTLFVSLGISAIIATSITLFRIMKFAGAAYLFYLGFMALKNGGLNLADVKQEKKRVSFGSAYINAVIIDVTNPKVALFFMAFFPQFYRNNGMSRFSQFMLLGGIIVCIGFIIEGIIVLLADKIASFLQKNRTLAGIIDKFFGTLLIGLGVRLIFEERS